MNRGYAFGFLIVLLVVILGIYVAFTGFMSSRDALRIQSTDEPVITQAAQIPATATNPPASPTPTIPVLPSPVPGITATLTAAVATDIPESPVPAEPTETEPAPPPTESPAAPSDTPPPASQPPTPAPIPAYQFRLAGPAAPDPKYPVCCYIYGTVRDAGGTPLEGVQVKAFNEWNDLPPALSKGGGEAGQYNITIGRDPVAWYVIIVDAGGNQISSQVQVPFNPDTANGYRVDWQRTY